MRAAVLLLCLALVRDNGARVFRPSWPHMDSFTLEEQNKIHHYEQEIQMLQEQKTSSSQETNENTSDTSNEINHGRRQHQRTASGSQESTSGEVLISLQELLTSGQDFKPDTKDPEHIFDEAFAIMRHVSEEDKQSIREAYAENKDVTLKNATQMIEEHNYGVEKHEVKTEDGYYITLLRIQPKQNSREVLKRPVVLLVHGLLGSADDWLLMGPKKSLAYQMTDAGFDVWLGNVRGSKYSQRHTSKHPAQSDFWQFSIDEIAAQDLPAMIDYTLKVTQENKLHYVGHSLGATTFFAMASTHPEYREKVAMMYALSPMVYMNHVRSPLLRMISPKSRYYKTVHQKLGHGELKPNKDFMRSIGGKMYEDVIGTKQVSYNLKYVVSGVDSAGMDRKMMPIITKHLPAGASARQIKQYGQAKAAEELRKYDYGVEVNRKVYGQSEPPKYNMTEVHVPVAIYYSEEDLLAHPKDVERLHSELPDVRDYYKVPEKHFSHMDFQFSKTTPATINQRLIDSIKETY